MPRPARAAADAKQNTRVGAAHATVEDDDDVVETVIVADAAGSAPDSDENDHDDVDVVPPSGTLLLQPCPRS